MAEILLKVAINTINEAKHNSPLSICLYLVSSCESEKEPGLRLIYIQWVTISRMFLSFNVYKTLPSSFMYNIFIITQLVVSALKIINYDFIRLFLLNVLCYNLDLCSDDKQCTAVT
jgi:hypothetical protein